MLQANIVKKIKTLDGIHHVVLR